MFCFEKKVCGMATRRSQRLSQKLKSYKEEESVDVDSDDDRDEDYDTGSEEDEGGDDDDDDDNDDDDDDDYIFQRKKKKVDEETSIYFKRRKSRQGKVSKVAKKSEIERKLMKSGIHAYSETISSMKSENGVFEYGTSSNQPVGSTAVNVETKTLSLSDSESSSDEFVKAPVSLGSLGDFEKIARKSDENESTVHINKDNLDSSHGLASGSHVKEVADRIEHFYDFSQIIKSQQLINNIKKESENTKTKDSVSSTNQVSKSQKQTKNVKRTKLGSEPKEEYKSDISNLNVSELLNLGERSSVKCDQKKIIISGEEISDSEKLEDSSLLPKEGIQVTIQLPDMQKKKKKKQGFDLEAAMKRRINLIKKENQSFMHKVHVLCWIAHGHYLNDVINSSDLMGLALSLIPSQHCYPPKRADLTYLEKLVQWFAKKIPVNENHENEIDIIKLSLPSILQKEISEKVAFSKRDLILIFVCILRSLGLSVRLIISLQPVPLKPPASELLVISIKKEDDKNSVESKGKKTVKSETNKVSKPSEGKKEPSSLINKQNRKPNTKSSQYFSSSDGKSNKESNRKLNKTQSASKNKKSSSYFEENKKSNDDSKLNKLRRSLRDRKSTQGLYADKNSSCSDDEATESGNVKKSSTNEGQQIKKKMSNKKNVLAGNRSSESSEAQHKNELSGKKNNVEIMDTSSGEDFEPSKTKSGSHKKQKDRRVLSSDEDPQSNERKKKKVGSDYWAEVFLEAEEKWISVDVIHGKVHCVQQLYSGATHPLMYVLAWNNDKTIKDVTRRYAPQWMTVTRKCRVDSEWWSETMAPFAPAKTAREKEEDEDLDRQLQDKPLPTSVAEYKNHPLYALKRHLLKFEGIYPPDAPPLGFVRGEPVYSRSCVMELHTRETWIKEAKSVRKGEEPYKIVKARPKYDKMSGKVINDLPLPLFGYWQVEDYVPPPAVDGKVPRNEYGNVEMYKPCMLPPGTVHLQIPGLNRTARKLSVDCAPAVVGWEFHCGGSHPILDGFIVCEEFKDMLLDAWNQETEESARRAKEKEEKEVYGNWKRLIKGLLIRERLKARYDFGTETTTADKHKKRKAAKTKNRQK